MATEYKVSLDKVIKELSLKTVYMPVDASTIDIVSADIDRPGLELTGYLDFFEDRKSVV